MNWRNQRFKSAGPTEAVGSGRTGKRGGSPSQSLATADRPWKTARG